MKKILALVVVCCLAMTGVSLAADFNGGYFTTTDDAEPHNLMFNMDGTGYSEGMNWESFNWSMKGDRIVIDFGGGNALNAQLVSSDVIKTEDGTYKLDPKFRVSEFSYTRGGYEGSLALGYSSSDTVSLTIDTVQTSGGFNTCEVHLSCREENKPNLTCTEYSGDNPGVVNVIFRGGNFVDIKSTFDSSEFCGRNGRFVGTYRPSR